MLCFLIYREFWAIFNSSIAPSFYTVPAPLDQWATNFSIYSLLFWRMFVFLFCLLGLGLNWSTLFCVVLFAIDALHGVFLVIVSLDIARFFFFPSYPEAQIVFFHWFSHSQKMLLLLNLMPIVDLGNLSPCVFWCNFCVLKSTQMHFKEVMSLKVLYLSRLVGHYCGKR